MKMSKMVNILTIMIMKIAKNDGKEIIKMGNQRASVFHTTTMVKKSMNGPLRTGQIKMARLSGGS